MSVQLKCFVSAHIAFCSSSLNASSLLCQCPREHHGFQNQSSETATVTWLMLLADEGHGNRRCQPVDMQVEVVLKFARFRSYETRHGGRGTDRHRPPLLSTKLGGSDRESRASPAFRPFLTMTVTALKFRISIRIHLVCPTIRIHERERCNRSGVCPAACRDSRNARPPGSDGSQGEGEGDSGAVGRFEAWPSISSHRHSSIFLSPFLLRGLLHLATGVGQQRRGKALQSLPRTS